MSLYGTLKKKRHYTVKSGYKLLIGSSNHMDERNKAIGNVYGIHLLKEDLGSNLEGC